MRPLTLLLLAAAAFADGEIASKTLWATRYYVRDSGRAGPTVLVVGGLQGNEPAGVRAADQIRRWPVRRGRLVVIPRANVRALAARTRFTPNVGNQERNLNRNFPRPRAKKAARGALARALWAFVHKQKPDWLIDLQEGYDFHVVNRKSVGSSVIVYATQGGKDAADAMLEAVNASLPATRPMFVRLLGPVPGGLARAAAEHLGAEAMTLETTTKGQPLSRRTRQHRLMVHALLRRLEMIDASLDMDAIAHAAGTAVALYDAGGTGGPGAACLTEQLGGYQLVRIGPDEIRSGALREFGVVVFAGGTGSGQARALGEQGRVEVKRFVEDGGGFVGICAGSYLATARFSWGLKILDAKTRSPLWRRGRGRVKMELTRRGREILGDLGHAVEILYANGPILAPAGIEALPDFETLALFRTEVAKNNTPKGIMVDSPAIVAGRCGKGRVLCFSAHPEQTQGLEELVRRAVAWTAARDR